MDILNCSKFKRHWHYGKTNHGKFTDGRGDEDTLETLDIEDTTNDPLTKLIDIEDRLLRERPQASFRELSADLNLIIAQNL